MVLLVLHSVHHTVSISNAQYSTCCDLQQLQGKHEGEHDCFLMYDIKKVKVSHSLIAVGAAGVRVPLYLGHS